MPGLRRTRMGRRLSPLMLIMVVATGLATVPVTTARGAAATPTSVTIYRDEHGVPHVYSDTAQGLFEGAGYVTAQDRLWQADILRRLATGTLSELLGPGAGNSNISNDTFFRLFTGGPKHRAALYAAVPAQDQADITAFRDGINRWIAKAIATGQLPVEYLGLGITPRKWTVDDVVATAMLGIFEFGSNGMDELTNAGQLQTLIARLGGPEASAVFTDAHWVDDPSAPTTIPGSDAARAPARAGTQVAGTARLADISAAAAQAEHIVSGAQAVMARVGVSGVGHSNAIALSGDLTQDGSPLLLGGPQTGYTVPQSFMEIGLHGAGFDVTGVTLAGNPGVQIGASKNYAWTVTSGGDDNQDWYAEFTDPSGHPGRYLFNGHWLKFTCHTETILVAGGPPVTFNACDSVHGPVLGTSGSVALTLRDVTRENLAGSIDGFFGIAHASSLTNFVTAGRQIVGSLNLTYADVQGNIAYAHVGSVPIRVATDNPFLPHIGTGTDEWQGYIPANQMPFTANPDQGWLTNWNNKPQAGWNNASSGFWDWGPVQRVQVIMRQLAALPPHSATVATLENIIKTTGEITESPVGTEANVFVQALLPMMLANLDTSADSRLPAIQSLLSGWDQLRIDPNNDGSYDSPAVTVYNAWYSSFVNTVFVPQTGAIGNSTSVDPSTIADMTARLFEGSSAALPLNGNYLGTTTPTQAATQALIAALDQLTTQYGTADTTKWLTPDAMIHYSPLGAGSVPDIIWMNRGTYNQIIHVGGSDQGAGPGDEGSSFYGENVVAPGQSGDVRSPYFADQLPLYATWQYKPMRLTRSDLNGHITSTTVFYVS
jgi:penicillin G amidase